MKVIYWLIGSFSVFISGTSFSVSNYFLIRKLNGDIGLFKVASPETFYSVSFYLETYSDIFKIGLIVEAKPKGIFLRNGDDIYIDPKTRKLKSKSIFSGKFDGYKLKEITKSQRNIIFGWKILNKNNILTEEICHKLCPKSEIRYIKEL